MKNKAILQKIGNKRDVPAALIIRSGKILIGLRNYTPDKWKHVSVWTVPGGRCGGTETLEVALRREVSEEVGINDLVITDYLGTIPGAKDGDIVYVFKAETREEPILMEPEKFSEWKWCPVSKIPPNFINPKLLNLLRGDNSHPRRTTNIF